VNDKAFWFKKRVFITGHTGFKGSWLCLWLSSVGAEVTGYALQPPTDPSLYRLGKIDDLVTSIIADVRDGAALKNAMADAMPDVVIHMAAQPLVRDSYKVPVDTYAINVMGTVNLFEAVRQCSSVRAVINVTTDKCYENHEWVWGYREQEALGGYDPYSSSKACSELVTASYRNSFFNEQQYASHGVAVASARAGNVIGGGDWATDRLIPDCVRSLLRNEPVLVRNPDAVRPWQHVLEPLSGYLVLAEKLYNAGPHYAGAWNFGPSEDDARPVSWLVKRFCEQWGEGAKYSVDQRQHPHEAHYLKLDCSKARQELGWRPRWGLDKAIDGVVAWSRAYQRKEDLKNVCLKQIDEYMKSDTGGARG
jgi:CDP-glucose 4,6-dehydratase